VSTQSYFKQYVWGQVLSSKCVGCHNNQGVASATNMVLQTSSITGYMDHNYQVVSNIAGYEFQGTSLLLLKPSQQISHKGGLVLTTDSEEYAILESFIPQVFDPVECEEPVGEEDAFFQSVVLTDALETYRKATMLLSGRHPTVDEEAFLQVGGEAALSQLLDALLLEDGFYQWVRETFNDRLLTDKYLPGGSSTGLMNTADYPNRRWYDDLEYPVDEYFRSLGKKYTNPGVAREPLELIVHVVKNNRPFTEVLTADYIMVNPFSAHSYGVADAVTFNNPMNPAEFQEVQIPGIPHSGVMTSLMFLNRFPTTATNRNRHRSRVIWDLFLATDVLKLAERPIDPTSIVDHNPTMFNKDCAVCHEVIDPLGGTFQNWNNAGRYLPPEEGWFPDMRPPGYGDETLPIDESSQALQWLAPRLTGDGRFVTATVRTIYNGLLGSMPLLPPNEAEEDEATPANYQAKLAAYEAQQNELIQIGEDFVASNYNLRTIVKGLIESGYFRARSIDPDVSLSEERLAELEGLGAARLATPEQLERRVEALTGFPWRNNSTSPDYLLNVNEYLVFFGGIDSNNIIKRLTSPNGIMASVGERLANEVACRVTGRDMTLSPDQRRLFPYVEKGYVPEDENGFPIPQAINAIKENIRYLHWRMLGERLSPSHPDLEAVYQLFYDTWKEGMAGLESGDIPTALPYICRASTEYWTQAKLPAGTEVVYDTNYVIRSWMAVMSYYLSDFDVLYQ